MQKVLQQSDDIFVHGKLYSVDDVWLIFGASMRVPLNDASSISRSERLPDFTDTRAEELLQYLRSNPNLRPREKCEVSYRLTGWAGQDRDFPNPNYKIYTA